MELHRRALSLRTKNKAPLEVRAQHAAKAGDSFSALMLLERMGNVALLRGDPDTAVAGYQRGLEIARAEALETGDLGLDDAIATFSRKLGSALMHQGDVSGGEGVLREALELTRPGSLQRARMLLGLGEIVTARTRSRDAHRLLAQALEIAQQLRDGICEADVHMLSAALYRSDGDLVSAIQSDQRALDLYARAPGNETERVQCGINISAMEIERADWTVARDCLRDARALAQQVRANNLVAQIVGLSATIDARQGKKDRAVDGYGEAIRLAHEAGDADGARRWMTSRQALSDVVDGRPTSDV
jgi:serine/threonine-protein kinase